MELLLDRGADLEAEDEVRSAAVCLLRDGPCGVSRAGQEGRRGWR